MHAIKGVSHAVKFLDDILIAKTRLVSITKNLFKYFCTRSAFGATRRQTLFSQMKPVQLPIFHFSAFQFNIILPYRSHITSGPVYYFRTNTFKISVSPNHVIYSSILSPLCLFTLFALLIPDTQHKYEAQHYLHT
jgi:hypothetical protein